MSKADDDESLALRALGDFEASNESAEVLQLGRRGTTLRFPSATQAVEARIDNSPAFWGYSERRTAGLDVLLWPERSTCSLFRPDGTQGYPGQSGGQALLYLPEADSILAAGGNDALVSDAIVGSLTFDVTTGAVASFDTSEDGVLRKPRAFATATTFGDHVLVAGGENPLFGLPEENVEPRETAELFVPEQKRFVGELELQHARTRHAAVTLPDGRTLLVGGRTKVGSETIALRQLELVDPATRLSQIGQQIAARIEPQVVRLTDGRIFVGGGTTLDGAPVEPSGQWLTAQAEPDAVLDTEDLPARLHRAFAAMPGGGLLAVGGCEYREPADEREATSCASACERGCPPLAAPGGARAGLPDYDAWWFDAAGTRHDVPLDGIAAPRPILLPGSDGSPWLVATSEGSPEPRLYRFNLWTGRFSAVSWAGGALPRPGYPPPVSPALDTFVWLDDRDGHGELWGLRLGTRNRFAQDVALVLQSDPLDRSRPLHLAPDRPLSLPERYDGRLHLDPGSPSPVVVAITDTDYADVTVAIHLADDESAPPRLWLSDILLGSDECPWPTGDAPEEGANVATLVRSGPRVELRFRGQKKRCPAPAGRVSIALTAGTAASVITRIDVSRVATPDP